MFNITIFFVNLIPYFKLILKPLWNKIKIG